eukprot:gb/GECG01013478.1/.p1 GENE.gb/GECG01013478.1/~~gb/GECG01013478.1/.p1  ORF type:complete len:479 (+),score=68.55 gb/GECG01013478.1/:1-1437(+)
MSQEDHGVPIPSSRIRSEVVRPSRTTERGGNSTNSAKSALYADLSAASFDELRWLALGADPKLVNYVSRIRSSLWDKERSDVPESHWKYVRSKDISEEEALEIEGQSQQPWTPSPASSSERGSSSVMSTMQDVRRNILHAVLDGLAQQVYRRREGRNESSAAQGEADPQDLQQFEEALEEYGRTDVVSLEESSDKRYFANVSGEEQVQKLNKLCYDGCYKTYLDWAQSYCQEWGQLLSNVEQGSDRRLAKYRKPAEVIKAWAGFCRSLPQEAAMEAKRIPILPGDDNRDMLCSDAQAGSFARPYLKLATQVFSPDDTSSSVYYEITLRKLMSIVDGHVARYIQHIENALWAKYVQQSMNYFGQRYPQCAKLEHLGFNVTSYLPRGLAPSEEQETDSPTAEVILEGVRRAFRDCSKELENVLSFNSVTPKTSIESPMEEENAITLQDFHEWINCRTHFPGATALSASASRRIRKRSSKS